MSNKDKGILHKQLQYTKETSIRKKLGGGGAQLYFISEYRVQRDAFIRNGNSEFTYKQIHYVRLQRKYIIVIVNNQCWVSNENFRFVVPVARSPKKWFKEISV